VGLAFASVSSEAAFDELVRAHHRAVSAYARALCSDRHLAEDAVQETFLRAWRYQDSYRSTGSFEGWLLTICRRCVIDLAQREQRQPVGDAMGHPDGELHHAPTAADHSGDIFDLIASLPLPQREVLVVCGWLGYEYEEAALLLDIPVGTVRSRLHRARAALDAQLRAEDGEAGDGRATSTGTAG
jgi:RNA polymerase sigma-70 factor (ECF subfamily)